MTPVTAEGFEAMLREKAPISFTYGGRPFPEGFAYEHGEAPQFAHAGTGLRFRIERRFYGDTGAMEWTGWFENDGENDSPQIRDVNILDLAVGCPAGASEIGASRGTHGEINDFEYFKRRISAGEGALYKTRGSSDFLPFVNVDTGGGGAIVGLGWTGNWFINAEQGAGEVRVTAGMPGADFYLRPGERVRTPRVLLLPWEGDVMDSHNALRRHMVRHHLPKGGDGQPQTPICLITWGGMKTHNHLKLIEYVKNNGLKYDCYWMDAGWYGPDHDAEEYQNFYTEDWGYNHGEWRVNRTIHPGGLMPVADAAHGAGMKFLLWCGAFGCRSDLGWYKDHPEWGRLGKPGPFSLNPKEVQFATIYMDDPEAVEFLSEQIGTILRENGADYYREDTSLPIGHPDEEGRAGIGEMKAVEGFYRYWDGLLARNPGMIIDNCGGGGHRLDLETMSRSYCFWRSDFNCDPNADPIGCQVGNYGLNYWVPLMTATVYPNGRTYAFRSGLGGGMPFGMFKNAGYGYGETEPPEGFDLEWYRDMIGQYHQIKRFLWGDYYPLTGCDAETGSYMAYQFDRPDLGEGALIAFRRQDCGAGRFSVAPRFKEGAEYELTDIDTGAVSRVAGGAGYEFAIGDKPGSAVVLYKVI